MRLNKIIINMTRGLFDGHYASDKDLHPVAQYWREQFPGDRIVIAQIISGGEGDGIPDHLFMARHIKLDKSAK